MSRALKYPVELTEEQGTKLSRMFRAGSYSATIYRRMRVLQALGRGKSYDEITEEVECSRGTIHRVAKTFCEQGFDAVFETQPRPGRPKKLGPKAQAILVELVATEPPEGRARWTHELLELKLNELDVAETVSARTIGRALKKMGSAREP